MLRYQIFGSPSSIDYDVMVFVDKLGTIAENHDIVDRYNDELLDIFFERKMTPKKINSNLGVLSCGRLVEVFKGTADECNNSLFYTYDLHEQHFGKYIVYPYMRGLEYKHLKMKRCLRFILSFYSRVPEWRSDIKEALRGDIVKRMECVMKIDFTKHTSFPGKKEKIKDIYKVLAFQLAQTLALAIDVEIYTKEKAILCFPDLKNLLDRKDPIQADMEALNNRLRTLLIRIDDEINNMSSLYESYEK